MAWFNFFRNPIKKPTSAEISIQPQLLDHLHINKSLMVEQTCILEMQESLETVYAPLPQRIFSIGHITLTPNINIRRYYLVDDDTWLQITYDNHSIHNIILFYWAHAKTIQPTELTENIKAPLTSLQWEHRGQLFDRCWQTPRANIPLEITENIHSAEADYKLTSQQMLFSRRTHHNRKEYWLYSLEQYPEESNYQQAIAQGFSLLEKDILIN